MSHVASVEKSNVAPNRQSREATPLISGVFNGMLYMASRGIKVIELHHQSPDGSCSCGKPTGKGKGFCSSPGKHPVHAGWQRKPDVQTTDPAVIEQWYERNPKMNYGCVGSAEVCILDPDMKDGKDGITDIAKLLDLQPRELDKMTFTVVTPSGGRHHYFTATQKYSNNEALGPSIDIRSGGGMVVGPGSLLYMPDEFNPGKLVAVRYKLENHGPMMALPEAAASRMRKSIERVKEFRESVYPDDIDSPKNIESARAMLRKREPAIQGRRGEYHTLMTGMRVRDHNISEEKCIELLAEEGGWNDRCDPPWEYDELAYKIRNSYEYPERKMGTKSAASDATLNSVAGDSELPKNFNDPFEDAAADGPEFTSITDLMNRNRRYSYIAPPVVPDHGTVFIAGSYGMFKTTVAEELAFALASDRNWMNSFDTKQGFVVLHHQMEDDIGTEVRSLAWSKRYGVTFDPKRMPVIHHRLDVTDRKAVKRYIMRWKARYPAGTRFVNIFDTWQRLLSGIGQLQDEKIQPLLDNLDYISREMNGPNIIAAHPPKAGKDADEKSMSVSGLMNVMGSATGILYLTPGTAGGKTVQVWVEKSRGADSRYILGHVVPSLYATGRDDEQAMLVSFYAATPLEPTAQRRLEDGQDAARTLLALDMATFFKLNGSDTERTRAPLAKLAAHLADNPGNVWQTGGRDLEALLGVEGATKGRMLPSKRTFYDKVRALFLVDGGNGKMMSREPILLPDGERQVYVTVEPSRSREPGKEGKPTYWFNMVYTAGEASPEPKETTTESDYTAMEFGDGVAA